MSDRLWIVRLTDGSSISTVKEGTARKEHANAPGSTLSYRPLHCTIKTPYIGQDDYAFSTDANGVDSCTHLPTGVVGWSDDRRDAYKQMLRALTDHVERQTETLVSDDSAREARVSKLFADMDASARLCAELGIRS